jgi:hypothetical protein
VSSSHCRASEKPAKSQRTNGCRIDPRRSFVVLAEHARAALIQTLDASAAKDLGDIIDVTTQALDFVGPHAGDLHRDTRTKMGLLVCRLAATATVVLRRRAPGTPATLADAVVALGCVRMLAAAGVRIGGDPDALATALEAPIDPPHLLHLDAWAAALEVLDLTVSPAYVEASTALIDVVMLLPPGGTTGGAHEAEVLRLLCDVTARRAAVRTAELDAARRAGDDGDIVAALKALEPETWVLRRLLAMASVAAVRAWPLAGSRLASMHAPAAELAEGLVWRRRLNRGLARRTLTVLGSQLVAMLARPQGREVPRARQLAGLRAVRTLFTLLARYAQGRPDDEDAICIDQTALLLLEPLGESGPGRACRGRAGAGPGN